MDLQFVERVRLAQYRTHMANERTLLAYWRTALAFLAAGLFLVRFIPSKSLALFAIILMLLGVWLFVYGIMQYYKHREKINEL